jgi:hypothetical protein
MICLQMNAPICLAVRSTRSRSATGGGAGGDRGAGWGSGGGTGGGTGGGPGSGWGQGGGAGGGTGGGSTLALDTRSRFSIAGYPIVGHALWR